MADTIDPQRMEAWRKFLTAHARVIAAMELELAEERALPLSWYEVLLLLREAPEHRLRMHELAESRLLSRSAATRLVDRIEAAGLVTRAVCDDDRRGTFVILTEPGRDTLRAAAPTHLRGIAEHFARHLDDDEAVVVAAAMGRIVTAIESSGG